MHKTANVLYAPPKSVQPFGIARVLDGADAPGGRQQALDRFVKSYGASYPKAAACLSRDRDPLTKRGDPPAMPGWQ